MKPSQEKIWLKHFDADAVRQPMIKRTVYDKLSEVCSLKGKDQALYYYGTKVTFCQLIENIDTLANAYHGIGVREGELVSVIMPTMPESIYSLYALNKIGAIPNFIDPRMDADRICDSVIGAHSTLLITLDIAYDKIRDRIQDLNLNKVVVLSAGNSLHQPLKTLLKLKQRVPAIHYNETIITWKDLLAYGNGVTAPHVAWQEDSVAAITYTGGTTGTPKGVMLTNDGLNTMEDSFCRCGYDGNPGERFLGIMPIFSSYGVGCGVHLPLCEGGEVVIFPTFTPDELGKLIVKHRTGHMMAVPAFYESIMRSPAMVGQDLSFMKTTGCGGDTMNPELEAQFNKFLADHGCKYPVCQGYGMSEMSGAATACFNDIYKDGSVGIPLMATTVGIFDPETDEELGYNEEGELCMTGRNMMLRYYNNDEETAHVMRVHDDGTTWVHSGDIGYIDEDGFVFIKGRIKQIIIKFDGHKVFPVSIESCLMKRNEVETVAVVGIPDPDYAQGDVPLAIVELKKGIVAKADQESLRKDLLAWCDERCEERGKPADIVFIDKMLYTGLNKHDYRKLAEKYNSYRIQTQ